MKAIHTTLTTIVFFIISLPALAAENHFVSSFPLSASRPWVGPQYWTNPMEDWRLHNSRLEVIRSGVGRNVQLLTRQLGAQQGTLDMSLLVGRRDQNNGPASVGFSIGIRSELGDYRSALFHGKGLSAGIAANHGLFIGAPAQAKASQAIAKAKLVRLHLNAKPRGDKYLVTLTALNSNGEKTLAKVEKEIPAKSLVGNLALVHHYATGRNRRAGGSRDTASKGALHWFSDWNVAGTKVVAHDDQTFGPILWSMHTLSRRVMKMTAQMPPVGATDSKTVTLQVDHGGNWKSIAVAKIDPLSRTAAFRIPHWDDSRNTPYRLVYFFQGGKSAGKNYYYSGTVRRNPKKRQLVVAGFTGNTDSGFPNAQIVRNVKIHDPDVLLFTGDQIYENVGGFGIHRGPVDVATLNYLRKWYMFGWAFRNLMRDRPALCLPDDHDVYQGNIWGNGGNPVEMKDHDAGGYAMPAAWVNMIQRTQTSHHPDAYDSTPIKQDITVYYGDMLYGRVSFAIIEDRKFKSGPKGTVATWPGRPDHVKDSNFDPASVNKSGLTLLGNRQLKFLRHWATDWRGADLKVVCSQTIFCNLANYHGGEKMFLVADLDANGWPQAGRNRALQEIRRGFALMVAGDQHLPSIVHHGIDQYGDAGYSFCVPSIAAGYPRSWRPDQEGLPVRNRKPGAPANTGDYRDGLGNLLTVDAIGNPAEKNRPGVLNRLHDKSSGYGIVRFDTKTRNMTMECWRLQFDAAHPQPQDQFPGWPKTIHMLENYGRKAVAYLPRIEVSGMKNPVVQVIDQSNGEVVYTLRISGGTFRPKVFKEGVYTIKVGRQESGNMQTFKGIMSSAGGSLKVRF